MFELLQYYVECTFIECYVVDHCIKPTIIIIIY